MLNIQTVPLPEGTVFELACFSVHHLILTETHFNSVNILKFPQ
jgi:hypothetical protein